MKPTIGYKNHGKCAWCDKAIILPIYVRGQVSWAKAYDYGNCGENTGHKFHGKCKAEYVLWLKEKPWAS